MEQEQDDFEVGWQFAELVTINPDGTVTPHAREAEEIPNELLLEYEDDDEEEEEEPPRSYASYDFQFARHDAFQLAQQDLLMPWSDGEYNTTGEPGTPAAYLMGSVPYPLAPGPWGHTVPTSLRRARDRHHPYSRQMTNVSRRSPRRIQDAELQSIADDDPIEEDGNGNLHFQKSPSPAEAAPIASPILAFSAGAEDNENHNRESVGPANLDVPLGIIDDEEQVERGRKFHYNVCFLINLETLSIFLKQCTYEPEIDPELYHRTDSGVLLCIFPCGQLVITGATHRRQIREAYEQICPILERFKQ